MALHVPRTVYTSYSTRVQTRVQTYCNWAQPTPPDRPAGSSASYRELARNLLYPLAPSRNEAILPSVLVTDWLPLAALVGYCSVSGSSRDVVATRGWVLVVEWRWTWTWTW